MNIPKTGLVWILAVVLMVPLLLALLLPWDPGDAVRWEDVPGPVDSWTVEWIQGREVYICRIILEETGEVFEFEVEFEQEPFPITDPDVPVVPEGWEALKNKEECNYG